MSDGLKSRGVLENGFGIIPMTVLADRRLSKGAKLLYAVIQVYARGNGSSFPSQKTLGDILNINNENISRASTELEEYGYITKTEDATFGGVTYYVETHINVEGQADLFGKTLAKNSKPIIPRVKEGSKELKELETIFYDKLMAETGKKPILNFGMLCNTMKKVLKNYGFEKAKELIQYFFQDEFAKKTGYSVTIFQTTINKALMAAKEKTGGNFDGWKQHIVSNPKA